MKKIWGEKEAFIIWVRTCKFRISKIKPQSSVGFTPFLTVIFEKITTQIQPPQNHLSCKTFQKLYLRGPFPWQQDWIRFKKNTCTNCNCEDPWFSKALDFWGEWTEWLKKKYKGNPEHSNFRIKFEHCIYMSFPFRKYIKRQVSKAFVIQKYFFFIGRGVKIFHFPFGSAFSPPFSRNIIKQHAMDSWIG